MEQSPFEQPRSESPQETAESAPVSSDQGLELLDGFTHKEEELAAGTRGILGRLAEKVERAGRPLKIAVGALLLSHLLSTDLTRSALASERSGSPRQEQTGDVTVETGSDMREVVAAFRKKLADFKGMGYTLVAENGITGANSAQDELDMLALQFQGFEEEVAEELQATAEAKGEESPAEKEYRQRIGRVPVSLAHSPLGALNYRYSIREQTPIELSDNEDIRFSRFQIVTKKDGTVRIYDWLNEGTPLFFEEKFTLDERGRIPDEGIERIQKELKKSFRELPIRQDEIDRILPIADTGEKRPTYRILKGTVLPPKEKGDLLAVLAQIHKGISITAVPAGKQSAQVVQAGPLSWEVELIMDGEKFERIGFSPLAITGSIKEIVISVPINVLEQNDAAGTINGEPVAEKYTDKYGNSVAKIFVLPTNSKEGHKILLIRPKLSEPNEEGMRRVQLDLSRLRLPDLTEILYVYPESSGEK